MNLKLEVDTNELKEKNPPTQPTLSFNLKRNIPVDLITFCSNFHQISINELIRMKISACAPINLYHYNLYLLLKFSQQQFHVSHSFSFRFVPRYLLSHIFCFKYFKPDIYQKFYYFQKRITHDISFIFYTHNSDDIDFDFFLYFCTISGLLIYFLFISHLRYYFQVFEKKSKFTWKKT